MMVTFKAISEDEYGITMTPDEYNAFQAMTPDEQEEYLKESDDAEKLENISFDIQDWE